MKRNLRLSLIGLATLIGVAGISTSLHARENVTNQTPRKENKPTASVSGCQPALAAIDLDINNVKARLMTGGDMWWNIGLQIAAYFVPASTTHTSQFAASCWIGGYDVNGQLKVAAQTYRQDGNDYWPGALDANGKITADVCANWDNFWKVDKSTITSFIQLFKSGGNTSTAEYNVINQWPAVGNANATGATGPLTLTSGHTYAPFEDLNGDGVYEPQNGEYPKINGDQFIWWVFNDAGNVKLQSSTPAIGVEIQTSAFAYSTQDYLNDATFYNYHVTNYGPLEVDSAFIAVWDDCDLGWYLDDYIGCDSARGLGIQYNGTNCDGCDAGYPTDAYGLNPPQVGLDYFKGPLKPAKTEAGKDTLIQLQMTVFDYYNNDFSIIGNPSNGKGIYGYMTGTILDGEHFSDDYAGRGHQSKGYGSGPFSNYVFKDDPSNESGWSECNCENPPGDRRFIFSSGPFRLLPGAANDITFGCIWAANAGGCPVTNFKAIESIDDGAQALFDDNFKQVQGPMAPRMEVRELDRQLVFYLVNDYGSNNYGENYGRNDGVYNDSVFYHQVVTKSVGLDSAFVGDTATYLYKDTLYKFQGYVVYQLANSSVSTGEIFDQTTGELNTANAAQVFQCDIHDGVSQIVNYAKVISVSDTTWMPQIKINGKDSGITHTFRLTQDAFPSSINPDQQLINYHNYYFVAYAYAYNNFAPFNAANANETQDQPFLISTTGEGFNPVPVVVGMPNPTNGTVGNSLNCNYGAGVIVTRVEGSGNGANDEQLSTATENAIVTGAPHQDIYNVDSGPVNIMVVDPVKVPAYNWILQIMDSTSNTAVTNNAYWRVLAMQNGSVVDTIYSEQNLTSSSQQILEKYGLAVTISQVPTIDSNSLLNDGYITSDVTFQDPSQPWLAGVTAQNDSSFANWLRVGTKNTTAYAGSGNLASSPCNFNWCTSLDPTGAYGTCLSNSALTKSTWAPYILTCPWTPLMHYGVGSTCGFEVAFNSQTLTAQNFALLPDVDLVFTNDTSKWTRCAVVEMQEDSNYSQNKASKFYLRRHASWNKEMDASGNPVYSTVDTDYGMSWFPGYAINEGTGQRLNIVFGEDSWMGNDFGQDMLWNPSSNIFNAYDGSIIFGGKHFVYVLASEYNQDASFVANAKKAKTGNFYLRTAYDSVVWMGLPTLAPNSQFLPLSQGLIPTPTRLRFRVNMPYTPFMATDTNSVVLTGAVSGKATFPYYTFSTVDQAPTPLTDTTSRSRLLSMIKVVPNPYYGYSGYENSRLDTRVRITNLPANAEVYIYQLDGTLVRTLSKSDASTPYIDWDIRNSAGLMVASGMYIMDVHAEGIGETILNWFGAVRPIDVSTY